MALQAMWVHGTAFSPAEAPANGLVNVNNVGWTDVVGMRQGWGTTFQGRAGHSNIFHVAIPSPVITNGVRAKLSKVFVMFKCGEDPYGAGPSAAVNLLKVDVWDGPKMIHTFGEYLLAGEHRYKLDTNNTFKFTQPLEVFFGLGLSVLIKFNKDGQVTFASAGADFEV